MSLPLLARTRDHDQRFALSPVSLPGTEARDTAPMLRSRVPSRMPGPGEQYRFHFDMSRCIGCKCCVVACNEQNANPAAINWRRVGEIEGGFYPNAQRA